MKKILITGASGYIGSQLIERLSKENVTIIGTDIVEKKHSIDNYTFVKGDLRSDDVKNLILNEKPNVIVHLAAIVSPTKP
ncbi:MAG: NAD(P)-dependent oxidoreductase [Chitinophagales bacterium]